MNRLTAIACALALCGCVTATKKPVVEVQVYTPPTTVEVVVPHLPAAEEARLEVHDIGEKIRAQTLPGEVLLRPRLFRNLGADRVSRLGQGTDFAFFEAFPADGTGTSGPCSTTPPTGTRGETLTFTRGSNGTCTKTASGGLATTGIANGDLVVLSSNQPRVEYDANGVLGLLVESSRTNYLLRSEEFDNAAWSKVSDGATAVPTITANACTAPDGTLTADRIQWPSVSGASKYTLVRQSISTLAAGRGTVFLRSYPGAGPQTQWIADGSSASNPAVNCSAVETSWSRCDVDWTDAAGDFDIGPNTFLTAIGTGTHPAADLCVWGAQAEGGVPATSYIPTTSATVTRSAEAPSFGPSTFGITTNRASVASSFQRTTGTAQAVPILLQNVFEFIYTGTTSVYHYPAVSFFGTLAMPGSGITRFASGADGATRTNCVNGTCESTAVVSTNFSLSPWTLTVGSEAGAKYIDTIISRICVDPDPLRCR